MAGYADNGPIDIGLDLVTELLGTQCPQLLHGRTLSWFARGWDNEVLALGDDLLVRVPRRHVADDLMGTEHAHATACPDASHSPSASSSAPPGPRPGGGSGCDPRARRRRGSPKQRARGPLGRPSRGHPHRPGRAGGAVRWTDTTSGGPRCGPRLVHRPSDLAGIDPARVERAWTRWSAAVAALRPRRRAGLHRAHPASPAVRRCDMDSCPCLGAAHRRRRPGWPTRCPARGHAPGAAHADRRVRTAPPGDGTHRSSARLPSGHHEHPSLPSRTPPARRALTHR